MDTSSICLSGPATAEFARVARVSVSAVATANNANIEQIEDIRLVIGEMVNCAVDCGATKIQLEFGFDGTFLSVRSVCDSSSNSIDPFSEKICQAVFETYEIQKLDDGLVIAGKFRVAV